MKKVIFSALFAACAAIGLSSCMNGDYDATPNSSNAASNPLNTGGTGGTGGGTGGGSGSFNWTGTDPMSAKVDGTAWKASTATYVPALAGFPASVSGEGPNNTAIVVNIPDNATANSVTSFNSTITASWSANNMSGSQNDVYGAALGSGGSIQILENDAMHVKGKFFFSAKNIVGTSVTISEGYFNVTK